MTRRQHSWGYLQHAYSHAHTSKILSTSRSQTRQKTFSKDTGQTLGCGKKAFAKLLQMYKTQSTFRMICLMSAPKMHWIYSKCVCVCEHVNVDFEVKRECLYSPSKVMWKADPSPTGDVLFFFIVFYLLVYSDSFSLWGWDVWRYPTNHWCFMQIAAVRNKGSVTEHNNNIWCIRHFSSRGVQ